MSDEGRNIRVRINRTQIGKTLRSVERFTVPASESPRGTVYEIHGFRSLREFRIELQPGLNLLVGPNGSGKTNFIDFLNFLAITCTQNASMAVSNSGGIAHVFSLENIRGRSPRIRALFSGIAEILDHYTKSHPGNKFKFEYEIEIRFSRASSAIYISKEWVKLKKLFDERESSPPCDKLVGVLGISRRSPDPEISPLWHVGRRLFSTNSRNPLAVAQSYVTPRTPEGLFQRLRGIPLAPDESILSGRAGVPAIDAMRQALTRGRSFNIIPDHARAPDDVSQPPTIRRDGSGLSSTLHALQSARRAKRLHTVVRARRLPQYGLDMVVNWTRLVFPDLSDIAVSQDPHTGKFLGYLVVGDEKPLRIPLQATSDGTLKWLSLVCLILTIGGDYSIEEPENFLHPKMQRFLIDLLREQFDNRQGTQYFVLSTHSETLINQFEPRELIIFNFNKQQTTCHRIDNPERILEEINRTGFGLGYYYASDALP